MRPWIGLVCAFALLSAAPVKQKFTGVITDGMCANGDHSGMRMGPTDAECTTACVSAHGAEYVLWDGKNSWTLSDQTTPEKFAGKKVVIMGSADSQKKTLQVGSIAEAK